MAITKEEWNRRAELAAAATYGEKHAGWYTFKRYGMVPTGIVVIGGGLGGAIYWLWTHIHLPSTGTGPGNLPGMFWIFATLLAGGTAFAFRPGRFVPAATAIVRAVVFSLLWLGVATYGIVVLM